MCAHRHHNSHHDIGPARCDASVRAEFLIRAQRFSKHWPTGAFEFKRHRGKDGAFRMRVVKTPSGKHGNLACFRCNRVLAAENFSQRRRSDRTSCRFCLKCGRDASNEALARGREARRRNTAARLAGASEATEAS